MKGVERFVVVWLLLLPAWRVEVEGGCCAEKGFVVLSLALHLRASVAMTNLFADSL